MRNEEGGSHHYIRWKPTDSPSPNFFAVIIHSLARLLRRPPPSQPRSFGMGDDADDDAIGAALAGVEADDEYEIALVGDNDPDARARLEIAQLRNDNFVVEVPNMNEPSYFIVDLPGPHNTPYMGRIWKVSVKLPNQFPLEPPLVKFKTEIIHPNISIKGTVGTDDLSDDWTDAYDMRDVFNTFIPNLLRRPLGTKIYNSDAHNMLAATRKAYRKKVRE